MMNATEELLRAEIERLKASKARSDEHRWEALEKNIAEINRTTQRIETTLNGPAGKPEKGLILQVHNLTKSAESWKWLKRTTIGGLIAGFCGWIWTLWKG